MADAVISGLVTDLLGRLTSVAIEEYGLLRSLKDDLLTLKGDFNQIQAVLEDAKEKQRSEKAVELWLKSLRSVSLKMENLLDEVSTEAMLQKLYKEKGMKYMVRAFFSCDHNQLIFRTKMAHKAKKLRRKLTHITAQTSELNLNSSATSSAYEGVVSRIPNMETTSFIHSEDVLGRDEEIKMVRDTICNPDIGKNEDTDILVYAIWGMGGLGKTTLAQLVYNDERVKEHFAFKCWVHVSQNFQVDDLIRRIIKSINKNERELSSLEEMQECLQEKLRGKRFLIVLDDVWIRDSDMKKWEELSKTLRCGAQGSIVMVTTREKITTSQMMERIPKLQHQLGCLSEEDSWSLFKKLAFAQGREGGDVEQLERIGKKIVKKCEGLPLAVKTLGGLMWSKSSTRDWQRVMDSDIWELHGNDILPALKLSYDNLPPHVKRCFAYCCMLPKGHEMGKDLLILLWKANRLIPSRGKADWYVLGEEIFNCLVWRSFFEVGDKEYKMHDLMHELARYVMRDDCLIIEPGKELRIPDEVLHLSLLSCPDFTSSLQNLEKLRSLRSVFIFAKKHRHIYDHIMYPRVLYIDKTLYLSRLPESVCKLKHLRYLNLSWSRIEVLPESIIYLQNLEVLLLNGCWLLRQFPEGMRYIRNLQHLEVSDCYSLRYLPFGIGKLTSLRGHFPVSKDDGAQIGELGSLDLIGPDLVLSRLKNVGGLREAQSADLKRKTHLLVLRLNWTDLSDWRKSFDERKNKQETWTQDEEVLEGLEPNPSLEKLRIYYFNGKSISPSWMVNLRSLVEIEFCYCYHCEHIPSLGKLPSLRVIKLNNMPSLKCFDDDDNTTMSGDNILFPRLLELRIDTCAELTILPGNLPKLKVLDISDCKKLVSLPGHLPELEVLDLTFCQDLVSLPGNLPKLEVLDLDFCSGLVSLPDEIQSFKDLNTLKIRECDNLSRRYAEGKGVDWPKISHIPHINIDAPRWWTTPKLEHGGLSYDSRH